MAKQNDAVNKRSVVVVCSEYVRMTITCPPGIAHPAKGGHLTVSIANYAHHNDDRGEGKGDLKAVLRREERNIPVA
jgi:hypothetical protein